MSRLSTSKFIWVPRILAGVMIVLFLLLSLDVFNESTPIDQQVFAFAMQSLPAWVVAVLLALSWKTPKVAGLLFIVLAIFFTVFFNTYRLPITFVIVSLVPIIVGVCFLLTPVKRR